MSPLLANIYLNYFDKVWKERCSSIGVLVRFADDYVALCRNEKDAQEALRRINILMGRLELKVHSEKTKAVNLKDGQAGFDFLGFHCRKVQSWRKNKYYLQYWPRTKAKEKSPSGIEILNWTIKICDILEFLHKQSPPIIFRDLKPANIIITSGKRVKLVDFGISRFYNPEKKQDTCRLGTPGFCAPEQYGTGQSDARTDVYSVGATLYHILSRQDTSHLTSNSHRSAIIIKKYLKN